MENIHVHVHVHTIQLYVGVFFGAAGCLEFPTKIKKNIFYKNIFTEQYYYSVRDETSYNMLQKLANRDTEVVQIRMFKTVAFTVESVLKLMCLFNLKSRYYHGESNHTSSTSTMIHHD